MEKLTREQAAIIGAFTGISCGPFADIQKLGDELMERPTWTHEYADQRFCADLKARVKPRFMALCAEESETPARITGSDK